MNGALHRVWQVAPLCHTLEYGTLVLEETEAHEDTLHPGQHQNTLNEVLPSESTTALVRGTKSTTRPTYLRVRQWCLDASASNDRLPVKSATGQTVAPLVAFGLRMAWGWKWLRCTARQALTRHLLRICGSLVALAKLIGWTWGTESSAPQAHRRTSVKCHRLDEYRMVKSKSLRQDDANGTISSVPSLLGSHKVMQYRSMPLVFLKMRLIPSKWRSSSHTKPVRSCLMEQFVDLAEAQQQNVEVLTPC